MTAARPAKRSMLLRCYFEPRSNRQISAGRYTVRRKRPRRHKERVHLADVVIDDRLATLEPERLDQLADALARQLGIIIEQPMDLVLKWTSLDAAGSRRYACGVADRNATLIVFRPSSTVGR